MTLGPHLVARVAEVCAERDELAVATRRTTTPLGPVLVHGTPQVLLHPVDLDEHLVQMPFVAGGRCASAQSGGCSRIPSHHAEHDVVGSPA
jgi:hypothetical protein